MVELTDREKAIIHTMFFMMNPATKSVPLNLRSAALMTMLNMRGMKFQIEELQEFSRAIEDEQNLSIQESFGFLNRHPDMVEALKSFRFQ